MPTCPPSAASNTSAPVRRCRRGLRQTDRRADDPGRRRALRRTRGANPPCPAPMPGMTDDAHTLLVVEDDDATRTFLADNLTADGYDVLVADGAREAWRLLETKFPDAVL